MISMDNQVALITGASRGIGKETAILLASLGADIVVHYHRNRDLAADTVTQIERLGRRAYLVQADISSHEAIKAMYAEIAKITDHLDILVNNAGISRKSYVRFMTEEEWDNVLDTNLKGAFLCSKYAANMMMRVYKGSIVNVSSVAAKKAMVSQVHYASSKAGLDAMSQTMAKELGRFGIRVNAVAPGIIQTNMNDLSEAEAKQALSLLPLGRIGKSRDVANAIAFLCTDMASYMTGQVIRVDGGMTL